MEDIKIMTSKSRQFDNDKSLSIKSNKEGGFDFIKTIEVRRKSLWGVPLIMLMPALLIIMIGVSATTYLIYQKSTDFTGTRAWAITDDLPSTIDVIGGEYKEYYIWSKNRNRQRALNETILVSLNYANGTSLPVNDTVMVLENINSSVTDTSYTGFVSETNNGVASLDTEVHRLSVQWRPTALNETYRLLLTVNEGDWKFINE